MALLTTLGHEDFSRGGGVYAPFMGEDEFLSRRIARARRVRAAREHTDEMMEGLWEFGKALVKGFASPFKAVAKGTGHFVMEASRGIASGDIGKVLASPFRGVGHMSMGFGRDTKDFAGWFYRPSKMEQWMTPIGGMMMTIAPMTGPVAPFLLAGGAALTLGGSVAGSMQDKERAAKAQTANAIYAAQKKKRMNMIWLGAAAIGGTAAVMAMT